MNILALDLAKQVGHAQFLSGWIHSGSDSFSPLPGQPKEVLFAKWDKWIHDRIKLEDIRAIGFELVDFQMSREWAEIYHGMVAIMYAAAVKRGIKAKGYSVRDIKMAATGQAKATKSEMVRTARLMWPDQQIIDDNQADALWVLYVCMRDLDIAVKKHPEMLI